MSERGDVGDGRAVRSEPAQGVRPGEDEVGHGSRFLQRAQTERTGDVFSF